MNRNQIEKINSRLFGAISLCRIGPTFVGMLLLLSFGLLSAEAEQESSERDRPQEEEPASNFVRMFRHARTEGAKQPQRRMGPRIVTVPSKEAAVAAFEREDLTYEPGYSVLDESDRPIPFVVTNGTNKIVNNPSTDSGNNTTQNEVSMATFGQRAVVGFNDSNAAVLTSNNFSGYAYSVDGGSTFIDGGNIPTQAGFQNGGDPVVAVDSQGIFYYVMLQRNTTTNFVSIAFAKSTNGGQTFNTPKTVTPPEDDEISESDDLDKPWLAVDPDTDDIHIVWVNDKEAEPGPPAKPERDIIQYTVSKDQGESFAPVVSLRTVENMVELLAPQITIGINGQKFVVWEKFTLGESTADIEFCEVPAAGNTCTPVSIATGFPRVGSLQTCVTSAFQQRVLVGDGIDTTRYIRVFEFPSIAVDRTNGANRGNIYIVWNRAVGADQAEVYFSRRANSGGSWLAPKAVKTNSKDQFFPAVTVSNDGGVAVMYYSRELDNSNNKIDVYLSKSSDAGGTFTHQRITTTSFNPPPTNPPFDSNFQSPCYMGDYNQVVSDGENFYLGWGDNRNLVGAPLRPDPDVFMTAITTQPKAYFAQVADGGGWRTKFLMTNLDKATTSTVKLELFKSDGTNFNALPGGLHTITTPISPSGTAEIQTIGGAAAAGWARLTTTTTALSGFGQVAQFFNGSTVKMQVGFLPIRPFKRGVFLAERQNPGRDTAVAIANQNESLSTTVTLRMRNTSGTQVGTTKNLVLGAKQHTAQFLTQLFPGEVPNDFKGTLLIESNQTNIAASVRSDSNSQQNANFPLFSGTFPEISEFADVVDGAGWSTAFGFANFSPTIAGSLTIEMFTPTGAPWSVLPGGTHTQLLNLALNGSAYLQTIGGGTFQRGWAKVTVDGVNIRNVGAFQVQEFQSGGQIDREAGDISRVPSNFSQTFAISATGVNTGYAVANPHMASSITVTFELFNGAGTLQGSTNRTLFSMDQAVYLLTDLFPTATSITGAMRISTTSTNAPVIRVARTDGVQIATYPVFSPRTIQ